MKIIGGSNATNQISRQGMTFEILHCELVFPFILYNILLLTHRDPLSFAVYRLRAKGFRLLFGYDLMAVEIASFVFSLLSPESCYFLG